MVGRLWEWSVVQAESMAETGIVTGLLAAPLLGVVTKEDADSAVVIDMARNILGNPYADDAEDAGDDTERTPSAGADGGEDEPQSPSDGGGVLGVTGVRQVGGGPDAGLAMGDQKSGWGAPTGVDAAEVSGSRRSPAGDDGGGSDTAGDDGGGSDTAGDDGGGSDTAGDDGGGSDTAGGVPSGGVASAPSATAPSAPAPVTSVPPLPSGRRGDSGPSTDADAGSGSAEGTALEWRSPDETGTTPDPGGPAS